MGHNGRPRLDPNAPLPPSRKGFPRKYMANGMGRPPLDWDEIVPMILEEVSQGLPIIRALKKLGIDHTGTPWKQLSSPKWREKKREALEAGALARLDRSHDRLLTLAEDSANGVKVAREAIDAARWEAEHAKWMAERSDSESWGRQDKLSVAQVSAIRVIVETPPNSVALPQATVYEALPVEVEASAPRLLTGGEGG